MSIYTANHIRYHVDVQGSGAPLLMLHGFTGSAASWEPICIALQERYQVFSVDLLGHGQTEAPDDPNRYRIESAAADLIALIAQLGLGAVHLLGYSMGGRLALYLTCHYPYTIRSLTLESTSPGLVTEVERQMRRFSDESLADRIEQDGLPKFVDYWETLPLFATQQHLSEPVRQILHDQRLRNNPRGLANSLRGMGTGVQPPLWTLLGQIAVPTLLFSGSFDVKFTVIAQQMQAKIGGSRLITVPEVGHTIHLEQPTAFIKPLSAFLDETTA